MVATKAKFKVGDRVRVVDYPAEYWLGTGVVDDLYAGEVIVRYDDGKRGCFNIKYVEPVVVAPQLQPQPLTIRAGRFYRTRDGRKVGPMEAVCDGFTANERIDGIKRLWQDNGAHGATYVANDARLDIIAEWVDEPAAVVASFKVGDRVEFIATTGSNGRLIGKRGVIAATYDDGYDWCIRLDEYNVSYGHGCDGVVEDGYGRYADSKDLRLVAPATSGKPAIVALIENGQPKPAARPFVHPDRDAAAREARRLAGRHKGQEFGVYELVGTEREAKVYEHAWQWLAASGETCHARRELQRTGITGIQASRIVQEFVAAA